MRDETLVSYTVRWSQPYAVSTAIGDLQAQLEESQLELSDFDEARQVIDRIRSK
jgi:hypothetical protein